MTLSRTLMSTALAACVFAGTPALAKSYHAERFDVEIRVDSDGSVRVLETVVFVFRDGTYTRVSRAVPERRTDGLDEIVATMDGVTLPVGAGERHVEVDRNEGRRRIRWRFPETTGSHTFTLAYRARGAIERRAEDDWLNWTALPTDHDYGIDRSTVTVTWPEAARVLALETRTRGRLTLQPVDKQARGATIRADALGRDAWVAVQGRFAEGSVTTRTPLWQERAARHRASVPWFAAAAVTTALVLIAFLSMLWARAPRAAGDVPVPSVQPSPPGDLPVAMAGALVTSSGRASAAHAMSALLDLARRGAIKIEEKRPASRWSSKSFIATRLTTPDRVAPHERELLDIAFAGEPRTEVSTVSKRIVKHAGRFQALVERELFERRLLDRDRVDARSALFKASFAILALGAAALVGAFVFLDGYGPSVLLIPAGIGIAGLAGLLLANTILPFSDEGLRQAARWKAHARHLRAVSRGRESLAAVGDVNAVLPLAAAFGLAAGLARECHRRGLPVPSWFDASASEDGRAAFVTFMSSSSGAGAHGGGAGGAGGAGGGSSGAS